MTFPNHRGQMLSAEIDLPVDRRPIAWVIFAHCFTCSKDLRAVERIACALTEHRFGVLRFDFTGLGSSEGDFSRTDFSSNVDDLVAAAEWLSGQGGMYGAPAILVGHSLGGAAVLQAASRIPSVRAVATIAAPADPNHVKGLLQDELEQIEEKGSARVNLAGREFLIRKDFLEDLETTRMQETVRELDRSLLILHSPLDTIVGVENAAELYGWARHPKSFVSLDTADHLLSNPDDAEYAGTVIGAWAERYVEVPTETREIDERPDDNRIVAWTGAEGYRTELLASGHTLLADEPESLGGTNAGPTPYDLLAAALASCTSITLRMYADRKGWPVTGIVVRVRHTKIHREDVREEGKDTVRKIDQLEREVELHGDLTREQRERMLQIAGMCPVHRTLEGEIKVITRLASPTDADDARR